MEKTFLNKHSYFFPLLVVSIVLSTFLAVRLDIPYFRQISSVIFLGFLPGWLIIRLLKLDNLDTTSKFVLTVGLSQVFVIFFGLIVNQISLYFGYLHPLNENVLTITFSLALIFMAVILNFIGKWPKISLPKMHLSVIDIVILLFSAVLPLLSIVGTILMNFSDNNILLMVLLSFIALLIIIVIAKSDQLSPFIYPFIILMIGLSLTLMWGFRSNHIVGVDAHHEYLLMQMTAQAQHWQIFEKSTLDSCLSISLLPTIYNVFLNINPEYLFKVFYPVLFSISPVVLYVIYKQYVGRLYAFIASAFFMSFMNFQTTTMHARTNTAILFVALALLALFHEKIHPVTGKAFFVLFLTATIVSHYSTTYVLFFVLLIAFIGSAIYKFILQENSLRKRHRYRVTGVSTILFFALIFIWYSYVIEVPFNSGVRFISATIQSLHDFFVLESRNTVPAAFGVGLAQKQLPHHIEFVFNWLTIILMLIGVYACCLKESLMRKLKSVKNLDKDYLFLSISSVSILVIAVLFPMISVGYAIDRIYIQMLVIVSLFIVIGTISIIKFLNIKINPKWVLLLILIPYFWGQTSFTYQIMGAPRSMVLSTQNNQYDLYYVLDSESHACSWLNKYFADREGSITYADFGGIDRLLSQGPSPKRGNLTAVENEEITGEDYIYLRNYNIANNKLWYKRDYNYNEYKDKLINKSLVYSTATSAIYK